MSPGDDMMLTNEPKTAEPNAGAAKTGPMPAGDAKPAEANPAEAKAAKGADAGKAPAMGPVNLSSVDVEAMSMLSGCAPRKPRTSPHDSRAGRATMATWIDWGTSKRSSRWSRS